MNKTEYEIKNKIELYEIKTSSKDILKAYEAQKKVKEHKHFFFHKPFIKFALPVSLAVASIVIGVTVYFNLNNFGDDINSIVLDTSDSNLLNKEVGLLVYNIKNKDTYSANSINKISTTNLDTQFYNATNQVNKNSSTTTIEGYQDKVEKFDIAALAFYYLDNKLDTKITYKNYSKGVKYNYGNKTYKRKNEYYLNSSKLYDFYYEIKGSDDKDKNKWNLSGIIIEDNNTYFVNSLKEKEIPNNKYEIKTTFSDINYTYQLRKEIDSEGSEYKFTKTNSTTQESFMYSIKKDAITSESLIIINDNKNYVYNLLLKKIDVYLVDSGDYQFSLSYNETTRTYNSIDFGIITK